MAEICLLFGLMRLDSPSQRHLPSPQCKAHQPWQIPAMLPRKPWQTMANHGKPAILIHLECACGYCWGWHRVFPLKKHVNTPSSPSNLGEDLTWLHHQHPPTNIHQPLQHPESNSETLYGLVSSGSVLSNSGPRGVKDAPTTGVDNHSGGLFHGIRLGMFHGITSPTILRNIKGVTLLFIHNLS